MKVSIKPLQTARLDHPKSGHLQQGAIFNCVHVPRYESCCCCGIILTARCDLEHGKFVVVNFLPIVRFTDWAKRELCAILAKRARAEVLGSIQKQLSQKMVTKEILETFPLADIVRRATTAREQIDLLSKCNDLEMFDRVISLEGSYCGETSEFFTLTSKQCQLVTRDLIKQNLSEFYFLNAVDVYDSSLEGYVVLMRRVQSMDPAFAQKITIGIEKGSILATEGVGHNLTFEHEPLCMITGVLRSPDIEHIMQQFSNLFTRIGLDDQTEETIKHHVSTLNLQ